VGILQSSSGKLNRAFPQRLSTLGLSEAIGREYAANMDRMVMIANMNVNGKTSL
jgi:hypothetical protein